MQNNTNNSLCKPLMVGAGRANLTRVLRSYFDCDESSNQYKGLSPMTQRAQEPCDNAALSAGADGNGNLNGNELITRHVCDGVEYTYVTPLSRNTGLDFLAASIRTKDLNTVRIVVVCQYANEAAQLMQELGKRCIGCLLINEPTKASDTGIRLWNDGLLNSALVVCDDVLPHLSTCNNLIVNYLIHSSQTLPHVFQKRIQLLIPQPVKGTRVLVIRCQADIQLQHITKEQMKPAATTEQSRPSSSNDISAIKNLSINLNKTSATKELSTTDAQRSKEQPSNKAPDRVYTYNRFGIFAWSRYEQIFCYNATEMSAFDPKIKEAMQLLNIGQSRAKRVQRFAWPHAAAGRSLCVIGNESIGKTWCYLPTLCQRVLLQSPQRILDDSDCGPSCIILCATAKQGEQIANWCLGLLGKPRVDIKQVIKAFYRPSVSDVAESMKRPCGILITTAEQLIQLHQLHSKTFSIFNPVAISCVAFDGIDSIWRAGRLHCEKIIQWLMDILRFERGHSQLFVVGRLWIDLIMVALSSRLPDVLLLFEDALEATVFAGLKLELLTTSSQQYEQDILKLLVDRKEKHIVLACNGKADAARLSKLLHASNINSLIIYKTDQKTDLTCREWCEEHFPRVLVVTDDVIPKLRAENIEYLLHYEYNTWPRFKARFSMFYGSYQKIPDSPTTTSTILVRPGDVEQIWLLCDFMLKHDRYPPESYLTMLTEYRMQLEAVKPRSNMPLCRQLMSYGNCIRHTCQYRHILWDYETELPEHHPSNGEIKFEVLSNVTPAQLAVKFLENKTCKYFLNTPVTKLGERIELHYENQSNHRKHVNPELGNVCVLKINKLYQRVGVTRLDAHDRIEVKQLDAGVEFHMVDKSELLVCEKEFRDEPFEAYNLLITGLTPFNMERIWPDDAKKLVRNKFFNRLQGKQHRSFTAEVDFAFHEIIFVKNVYDADGNDLRSFVLNNIPVHMDEDVKMRLQKCISLAKPFKY
ncbi:putative ATP-dependent RNA helicase SoYb isoform X2 [Drosophila hydei]|uniref:RNA helicase n=1 Tax=Drosophila hydei TaxID=7224 RepID=A0A6J1MR99_DROHY|nr:putative ATP-dependent RNA helicase SoYb isoform X2 [Drosophila hydei]